MSSKLENHWFKHDMNASNDNKIRKLEFEHKLEGYAVYWKILELLASNGGARKASENAKIRWNKEEEQEVRKENDDLDLSNQ